MKKISKKSKIIIILLLIALCAVAVKVIMVQYSAAKEQEMKEQKKIQQEKRSEAELKEAASHVYSHRGASKDAIEHTFKAYDLAISYGSNNIEQDLVISADGTLYVSHDLSAYTITGVNKLYSSMTDEEIDQLRTSDDQKILKQSDVFDKYGKSVNYIIELKSTDMATINAFIKLIKKYGYQDNVVVQCMELETLRIIEETFPKMKKLYIVRTQAGINTAVETSYVDIVSAKSYLMTESNCKLVHDKGKEFNVWTIDSESEIVSAINMGVDTYFTNDTELAIRLEKEYRKVEK